MQLMQGFLSDADFLDLLRLTELCLIRGQIKPDEVARAATAAGRRISDQRAAAEPRDCAAVGVPPRAGRQRPDP